MQHFGSFLTVTPISNQTPRPAQPHDLADLGCKAMLRLHCHQDAKGWDCPICEWLHHADNFQPGSGVVAIQEATWDVVNTSTARQDGCCVWVALVWPGWRWGWWLFSLSGSVSTDSVCWGSSTAFELGHAPWRLLGTYRPKPSAVYYFFFFPKRSFTYLRQFHDVACCFSHELLHLISQNHRVVGVKGTSRDQGAQPLLLQFPAAGRTGK